MSETTDSAGTANTDWFFTENGQRKGPLPSARLLELLRTEAINGDTPVWRNGFSAWRPLRSTELYSCAKDTPPPVAAGDVDNALVWTVAFAPLAYMFLAGFIELYRQQNPYEDHTLLGFLNFLVPATINAALCIADRRQLKRAGYADNWLTLLGILLAPAYLFLRANRLRQFPTYGTVWIACFVFSIWMMLPGG